MNYVKVLIEYKLIQAPISVYLVPKERNLTVQAYLGLALQKERQKDTFRLTNYEQINLQNCLYQSGVNKFTIFGYIFKPLFLILTFIGINNINLAKCIVEIGLKKNEKQILENSDLRKLTVQLNDDTSDRT